MQDQRFLVIIVIFLAAATSCFLESAPCFAEEQRRMDDDAEECFYEIGTYERTAYFVKLYKVSFHTIDPAHIAEMYRAQQEKGSEEERFPLNAVVQFLLDPQNRIPLKLIVETLRSSISYGVQEKSMREMLERAGYPVDENWNLTGAREHQEDVKLYVKTTMGLNSKEHEQLSRTMRTGDRFILFITAEDKASVTYEPSQGNTGSRRKEVYFSSSDVLRGVFSTYLSTEACRSSLKDELPKALMEKVLAACEGLAY